MNRVRVVDGALIGNIRHQRPARPRLACRDRILPPPNGPTVTVSTAAFVLFDTMFYSQRVYRDDLLPRYPEAMPLSDAMRLAHELTHVWQWQNRRLTGYHPVFAAQEHEPGGDPYLFKIDDRGFLDFGWEQQGAIVEEYVCCRALDPEGARTARLYDLLKPYFPDLARQEPAGRIAIPWRGAETEGICA